MFIRHTGALFIALVLATACWVSPAVAQSGTQASVRGEAQAETRVSAEMVKGKLNPATSKPGDEVAVRLNEDLKSNGEVLLKKGSTITGVVRNVKRAERKAESKGEAKGEAALQSSAQSMMEIEWLAPKASGAASQQLNFALQSIAYTNPLFAHQQQEASGAGDAGILAPGRSPSPSRGGGGLVGGALGGATSSVGAIGAAGGGVVGAAGTVAGQGAASGRANGQANAGLLATPSLLSPNSQTAVALQNNFGVSSNQLFMVGHGQAVSSGGTTSSMDIFSHMSNDTMITSPSRDFEVSSGAQMQFLVSGKGQK